MAETDEPTDDLRTAATVAATTAARVVEATTRELSERAREAARQAERIAETRRAVDTSRDAGGYDTLRARAERAGAMERAGVPAEARAARTTADLMNGTDPAKAAASRAAGEDSYAHAEGGQPQPNHRQGESRQGLEKTLR
jgi:hypothetical protein